MDPIKPPIIKDKYIGTIPLGASFASQETFVGVRKTQDRAVWSSGHHGRSLHKKPFGGELCAVRSDSNNQ
jgi:hypothetical protein